MHFAFAIVSLFPGGGLQRDCVDIARSIRELGHEVTIFTSRKFGGRFAEDLSVSVLSVGGRTNHWRQRAFADQFRRRAAEEFDLLVGFDKLIGLDVLYCSERSMRARLIKNPILHLVPRYSEFVGLEKECFAPNRATKVLLLPRVLGFMDDRAEPVDHVAADAYGNATQARIPDECQARGIPRALGSGYR
jgi:UDP-glucose:(heptosyl)LPS alpha-1,3-glucosyltransferase